MIRRKKGYHGTFRDRADRISTEGFRAGVYFAEDFEGAVEFMAGGGTIFEVDLQGLDLEDATDIGPEGVSNDVFFPGAITPDRIYSRVDLK